VYYCCLNGWTAAHNPQKSSSNWGRTAGLIAVGVCLSFAVQSLAVCPGDVVINEIAWMGTVANSSDEWIEFYNNTDSPIDISNWSIFGADTGTCLNFSAADGSSSTVIPPHGFLIYANHEDDVRGSDGTNIVDIWDSTISMANEFPGQIVLYDAADCAGIVIDTGNHLTKNWFAGDAAQRKTMERANPAVSGNESANWRTNNSAIARNGIDAASNPIGGTPKARNSATNSPTADFTFIPEQPTSWDAVQFSDQSSDTDGTVIARLWSFGDGDTSIETNPTHWYELPGTYRTTLDVSDSDGLTGSIFKDVHVSLGPGDVDGSGVLDVLDVRIVLQAALGLITLSQDQAAQADVDGNGEVTKADAVRLSAHIIGIRE